MEQGISTRVLKGGNMARRPDLDTEQNSLGQDDLRELAGYVSLENAPVQHEVKGRERVHELPKNLETSPLATGPKHAGKPASRSQRQVRSGRAGTGK